MKGYELIKEMPNMKLGTKVKRIKDGQIYKLEKVECTKERKFSRVGNKKAVERFMTYKNMHSEFKVIEEDKEIEEKLDWEEIIGSVGKPLWDNKRKKWRVLNYYSRQDDFFYVSFSDTNTTENFKNHELYFKKIQESEEK